MKDEAIPERINQVNPANIRDWLYYLCDDPLPYRTLNYTIPGHDKCTLYEADDFIEGTLHDWGWETEKDETRVQAFARDETKNIHHQYSAPDPDDPWYTARNVYAEKRGAELADEFIVLLAHKDSQSWIDSPGANDNAIGTAGNMEIARILADYDSRRSIRFIWCNEEHTPWTSVTAAEAARDRGDDIIAVFNTDSIARKSPEDTAAGRKTNIALYTEPEGEALADLMLRVNEDYDIGLTQTKKQRDNPGDDDGSFVKAGYPAAILNIGSYPYKDPNYHLPTDTADTVDIDNAAMTVQAILAAVITVDRDGV